MFVLNSYFCRELRFVLFGFYTPHSDFYSEIQELTRILLRISEEKFGGWSLCSGDESAFNKEGGWFFSIHCIALNPSPVMDVRLSSQPLFM